MPTYEYRCKACSKELEVVQSFSDDALTTCTACGGQLRKLFGNVGIAFKGSGFYKNDSRSKAPSSTASTDNGGADKSGSDKAGSDKAGSDKSGSDKSSDSGSTKDAGSGAKKDAAPSASGSPKSDTKPSAKSA